MMAFDPDAYLAAGAPTASFDPDAYLGGGPQTIPESNKLLSNVVGGPVEVGLSALTGMGASAAAGLAGLLPGTLDERTKRIQGIQSALTYQPRTAVGRGVTDTLGTVFEKTNKYVGKAGGIVGSLFGKELEGQMLGEIALPVAATVTPAPKLLRSAREAGRVQDVAKASQTIEQMQTTAKQAETARMAQELGITLNPAESNPTKMNRVLGAAAGRGLEQNVLHANIGKPELIVKRDLGLPSDTPLTVEALKQRRAEISSPIRELASIENVPVTDRALGRLQALKLDDLSTVEGARKINKIVDRLSTRLPQGVSGGQLWDVVRGLRADASKGMGNKDPRIANVAEAKLKIANTIESIFDDHLTAVGNTELLGKVRDARAQLAKNFAAENVLNNATQRIDLNKLSNIVKTDNALTGDFAKLAEIAANHPSAFAAGAPSTAQMIKDFSRSHLVRTGIPGTIGMAAGALTGASPLLTGAIGAGLGEIGGAMLGKRLVSPASQAKRAVPPQLMSPVSFPAPARPELALAPIGEPLLPPRPEAPSPQGRGLLSLVDDEAPRRGAGLRSMPVVDIPIEPRLGPLYARGGVPQDIPTPRVRSQGALPPDRPPTLRSAPEAPSSLPILPDETPLYRMRSIQEGSEGARVPLPTLPPTGRGMLSLADDTPAPKQFNVESIPFKLRQEVLQNPEIVTATQAFIENAQTLQRAIAAETNGFKRAALEAQLRGVENRFAKGMRQLGIDNAIDALGLKKLYQSGGATKLPIVKSSRSGMLTGGAE